MPTQKINSPEQVNDLTGGISTGTLDARYLKLDASNDPVTGFLEIKPTSNDVRGLNIETMGDTSSFEVTQRATGSVAVGSSVFTLIREPSGDSAPTFSEPMMNLTQSRGSSGTISGGLLKYNSDATERVGINPSIQGTGTIAFIDGDFTLSPDGKLLLLKNHGTPKFYVNASGTAYSNDAPLIKESPTDGKYYARKSAGWEEATPSNGWIPVTETWTYASASTITIPSNGTTKYQAGMPIRFKQGGGYKYYNIYSVTATLITVIVNTDFTVANAAITDISVSFIANPFGYPTWFIRSTTGIISGSGGSAGSYAQSGASAVYRVVGTSIFESVSLNITNLGSWTGNLQLTAAVTASSSENSANQNGGIWASGAAPGSPRGQPYMTASSNIINFVKAMGVSVVQFSDMAANDIVAFRAEYRF